jgi:hypothetical protein
MIESRFAYVSITEHVIDAFKRQGSPFVMPFLFGGRPVSFGRKQLMVGAGIQNPDKEKVGDAQISVHSGFENTAEMVSEDQSHDLALLKFLQPRPMLIRTSAGFQKIGPKIAAIKLASRARPLGGEQLIVPGILSCSPY